MPLRHSAVLALALLFSCTGSTPDANGAHRQTPADSPSGSPLPQRAPGVESLGRALQSFGAVLERLGHILEQSPGSEARRLASDSVLVELDLLDSLIAPAPGEPADSHVMVARHETREAISAMRTFLAGGADTVTGSPGRKALELLEEHVKSASMALDQVGGYH